MIRALDAFKLARTKLRTRKVRLIVTLIIMSLLFSCLVFISLVTSGATTSLKDFGKEGLGSRYLVSAFPMTHSTYDNPALLEQLRPTQQDIIVQKKQLAKTLNIPYDEKTDQTLPIITMQAGPGVNDIQEYISDQSALVKNALNNQNNQITSITREGFEKLAKEQGAIHTYSATLPGYNNGIANNVKVLVDGKENFKPEKQEGYKPPTGLKSIETLGWNQISDELLQPFVLDGQSTQVGADNSIPVAAPYSAAQELLKLKKLPDTATSKDKLERLKFVRSNISSVQAQLCYRNQASSTLLQTAIDQQTEINANKGKKDYAAPSLQYNLPSEACGPTTIKSDKRTASEKKADENQKRFDAISSSDIEPVQGIINIRIIGITPDVEFDASYSASGIFSGIFSSSIGMGWFSPQSAIQPGTLAATAQGGNLNERPLGDVSYYAEFATLAQAKSFIQKNSCEPDYEKYPSSTAQIEYCIANAAPFYISAYGNNAGAIEDLQSSIWKIARFVVLGVVIIAVVIMMGTLGKIIADSRRETAVFRALGAKRLDISQIYFTYTILVSSLIAIIAFALGSIGAKIIDNMYSEDLSVNAIITYNAADTSKEFLLFSVNPLHLVIILGLIIASGIVSALLPLLTNMRRNPIRDMRDES